MKSQSPNFQAHDQIVKLIRQHDPQTILDGAVLPVRYAAAKPRILWILREVNGQEGDAWDLCAFLRDESQILGYPRWHSTYGAVAKISYGLINGLPAQEVGELQARSIVSTIQDIAVVNLNKRCGKRRVVLDKFISNAKEFTPFVELQIAALVPEIIIAAGTASLLPDSLRIHYKSLDNHVIGAVRLNEHTWLVKCYHSGQTRFSHGILYQKILEALESEEWRNR